MVSDYDEWDQIYREYPLDSLGWELGEPRPVLVEFVEQGLVKKGKALDLCCGAGTLFTSPKKALRLRALMFLRGRWDTLG